MLNEFLIANRAELIERCRLKVAQRPDPGVTEGELRHGIPLFLDQLIKTLQMEQTTDPMQSREVSGPSSGQKAESTRSEIGETAVLHGRELQRHGFTVEQVVHDYGDLCQAITDLAFEHNAPITIDEFRTLNRCLDNGIAVAVTEFNYRRDSAVADTETSALNERLGFFAHELRNRLSTANLALAAIKAGKVGLAGATGAVLDRSLVALSNLIDRTFTEVRLAAGEPAQQRLFSLAGFIAEVRLSASLEAQVKDCVLKVSDVAPELAVDADRDLLFAAVGNLLQNAFKFTRPQTEVRLNAYGADDRIHIDVEDNCGGLPPGDPQDLFLPFKRGSADNTGLGLGLSISRNSVMANEGTLTVRNRPGRGCVFTIDLPRRSVHDPSSVSSAVPDQR
ncbi:MAG: HAMP domain-containing histidine kinase [Acidobacteria bacterium]|nr:HAMP domain-containing histidine kinase [Acidobacteriota bacterium]MCA1612059.1 HAMP domain-containing histidine kinase [Acidobacteriota bacterium]